MESGPALGTLSLCLKTGTIPPTSMTGSLREGPVLKGKLGGGSALGNVASARRAGGTSALGSGMWRRLPAGITFRPVRATDALAVQATEKGPRLPYVPLPGCP